MTLLTYEIYKNKEKIKEVKTLEEMKYYKQKGFIIKEKYTPVKESYLKKTDL